jgi:hypothetical protein
VLTPRLLDTAAVAAGCCSVMSVPVSRNHPDRVRG